MKCDKKDCDNPATHEVVGWRVGVYTCGEHIRECELFFDHVLIRSLPRQAYVTSNQGPYYCNHCGDQLELMIDMGRVEAGIGGPRPTYTCPNWDDEHRVAQMEEIRKVTTVNYGEVDTIE